MPAIRSLLAALVLITVLAQPAVADQLSKAGPELPINTYTTGNQGFPAVAALPNGGYVVTWETEGQDGDSWGVAAQILAADGSAVAAEFVVPTNTTDIQWEPEVATDAAGNFVVVWQTYSVAGEFDIGAQLYDSSGAAVGGEFHVNSFTTGYQGNPTVAAADAGDFLVVWESSAQDLSDGGVYGQLYDSAGGPLGDEFRINETTAADQNDARVVAIDDGYVVTWESLLQDGSDDGVYLRFLGPDGSPDSGELLVNTFTAGSQEDSAIAVNRDGILAVVWEGDAQDGFGEGVFAQVLDADGSPIGSEMQLNTHTQQDQKNPRVTSDGHGGFVAIWTSELQVDGVSDDIFGQRFDASGQLVGDEFQVNSQATDNQDVPNAAGGPGERFLVVWRSFGDHDGSAAGVFGQRFELMLFADGFESGDAAAWSQMVP